jgi:hypothetical protein
MTICDCIRHNLFHHLLCTLTYSLTAAAAAVSQHSCEDDTPSLLHTVRISIPTPSLVVAAAVPRGKIPLGSAQREPHRQHTLTDRASQLLLLLLQL